MINPWTKEEFYEKMDSEGGLESLFLWGGTEYIIDVAPTEIRHLVVVAAEGFDKMMDASEEIHRVLEE